MMQENLTVQLKEKARGLGFTKVGIVPASPARRLAAYRRWLDKGYHGEMAYMARLDRITRREDLQVIHPGVNCIICVGTDYWTQRIPYSIAQDPSRGRISNYAWGLDYHDLMTERLITLAAWLEDNSESEVRNKVYVDTGALLERDHAELAGLGFIGKNTMLIDPRGGSWFFLGEILTTAHLAPTSPESKKYPTCGSCRRCLNACPTRAFPRPYVLDARRCISYLTIELKGWIPAELRPLMGNWIYGCDVCQEVCPFNRFAESTVEDSFRPESWDSAAPPLLDILALGEEEFSKRFQRSPISRIGRTRLVRNACVAAGNWGSQRAIPSLARLLSDDEPLLRGHAAWALGKIGGQKAIFELIMAQKGEENRRVREEILNAI